MEINFMIWRAIILLGCSFALIVNTFSQPANNIQEMKQLIEVINQKIEGNPIPSFPDSEIWGSLELIPEFKRLVSLSVDNWQAALNSLQEVASDRQSRIILFHSFAELKPEDYLKSSNQLLDLVINKRIDRGEFLYIILMSPNQKRWFWSYNHNNPEIMQFLNRVRQIFASDKNVISLVDFILSGDAKKRDEKLRKENPYFANQPIMLLMETEAQTSTTNLRSQASENKNIIFQKPSSFNWPILGWIGLGAIVVGLVTYLLLKK